MENQVLLTEWKRNLSANLEAFVDMYFTKGYVNPNEFPIRNEREEFNNMFAEYMQTGKV